MSEPEKYESAEPITKQNPTHGPATFGITPEMIKENPLLEMVGAFANNPLYEEVVKEIEKERQRQNRREARQAE